MYREKDIAQYQIIDAFFQEYILISQELGGILEIADEVERNKAAAIEFPTYAKYLESHTQEELSTKLMILAIAFSVAKAIVEAKQILQ
ncbi:hypothetical protein M1O24_00085 [Dehalococcoidia bacterium]|nr:hypothetical protein [Dehalococcoidia bacterium]